MKKSLRLVIVVLVVAITALVAVRWLPAGQPNGAPSDKYKAMMEASAHQTPVVTESAKGDSGATTQPDRSN
jgi:hypothetical protein